MAGLKLGRSILRRPLVHIDAVLDARLISATLAKFDYRPVVGDGEQPCCDTATVGFVAASPTPYVEEGPESPPLRRPGL